VAILNATLKAKLIPFANECIKDCPGTLVQEDKALSYAHYSQERVCYI
jgi:hypothetical protein